MNSIYNENTIPLNHIDLCVLKNEQQLACDCDIFAFRYKQ